ncbi:MAG: DUF4199 domain-containing protein [Chitinophagaceae bacterium]
MENKPTSHIVAGTIVGAVAIILFLVYYYTGLSFKRNFWGWIPALVTLGLIVFFVIQYGKANNDRLTFGRLFNYGFKTTAIFALIMTLFTVLVVYLFPEYKEKFMEEMYNQMDTNSNIPEEQKETALNMTEKFFTISMIGGALFMNMLIGTIASLIGSGVAKKTPQTPFDQQTLR